jgi:hypothetical protein
MSVKTLLLSGLAIAVLAATPAPEGHANLVAAPTGGGGGGGIAFVQAVEPGNCTGASICVATLTGTTIHNFFVIGANLAGASPNATVSSITSDNGTTCSLATGTQLAISPGGANLMTQIGYCQNNAASGTINITLHMSATPSGGQLLMGVGEFSGVSLSSADIGAGSTAGPVTADPVSSSVTTTQTNQLVFSVASRTDAFGFSSVGPNQIQFPSSSFIYSYQITDSIGTVTHSFNSGGSSNKIMSVAAFSHP